MVGFLFGRSVIGLIRHEVMLVCHIWYLCLALRIYGNHPIMDLRLRFCFWVEIHVHLTFPYGYLSQLLTVTSGQVMRIWISPFRLWGWALSAPASLLAISPSRLAIFLICLLASLVFSCFLASSAALSSAICALVHLFLFPVTCIAPGCWLLFLEHVRLVLAEASISCMKCTWWCVWFELELWHDTYCKVFHIAKHPGNHLLFNSESALECLPKQ